MSDCIYAFSNYNSNKIIYVFDNFIILEKSTATAVKQG